MKFFFGISVIAVGLFQPGFAKMHVYFNKGVIGFAFDQTQLCFTISNCWDDRSQDSKWRGLPKPAEMVWYEDKYCAGDSMSSTLKGGSIEFKGSKLYNKVSSFMVRQTGLYPTNGIVEHCHENALFNISNSSASGTFDLDLQ